MTETRSPEQVRQDLLELRDLIKERRRRRADNPLDFYRPLPHQARFHSSKARERVFISANRAGKSEANVVECCRTALGQNPHRPEIPVPNFGWVTSVSNEAQRDILQPKFEKFLGAKNLQNITRRRNNIWDQVRFPNGSVIGFKSTEMDRKVFQGASLHWAAFDEEPDLDILNEVKIRLADFEGDLWVTLTPLYGMDWSYDRWVDPETRVASSEVFSASMWDNAVSVGGYIPDAEIARMEREIADPVERRIRIYGEYHSQSGRIYKSFDRKIHCVEDLPAQMIDEAGRIRANYTVLVGIDTGRCFAACFVAVDYFGNLWLFDSYFGQDRTIHENARAVTNIVAQYGVVNPDYIIDPSSQFGPDLAEYGIICMMGDNEVMKGIDAVQRYMVYDASRQKGPALGNPKFYVVTGQGRNKRFLWEVQRYQWDRPAQSGVSEGEKKNQPKKVDDHILDTVRYVAVSNPDPSKPPSTAEDDRPIEMQIRDRVKAHLKNGPKAKEGSDPWGIEGD